MTPTSRTRQSPAAHLDADDVASIERELDALRQRVLDSRGARDAAYIRRVILVQRGLELGGRLVLLAGRRRPAWLVGTAALSLAKILDNMEIGHNVLHGQWDWMRDPKIHSSTWEWDHTSPARHWQRTHNDTHHRFTNIVGQDNDLGWGIMRVDESQPWQPRHLAQPVVNLVTACIFEWGITLYDLDLGASLRDKSNPSPETRIRLREALHKAGRQLAKDYLLYPLVSGPGFGRTLAANATANLARNLWSHSVIMCGHFPEGVETFEQEALDEGETRGEWYLRQMLGSANISGGPLLHLMTGNLSHQIEHHLYPDLPSVRYGELAVEVEDLFERYGLSYNARPLVRQVASAWHRVVRLSLPNGWLAETNRRNVGRQLVALGRMVRHGAPDQG
jgi:NADPH-dependent stearoyl-CoA 9-desaturase